MDEKVIQQLLNEEVPEWDYEDLKFPKDKKITNLNGDNLSIFTDGDEENGSSKMNSLSNFGGKTTSSVNDIISVVSSAGTNFLSPALKRKYYMSPSGTEEDNSYNMILPHRTGKIIKHAILTKVANQISSSRSKANTGYPVCCARGKYLAVGTSKGITFLFDLKQVMKFCVGMDNESATFGSVSSLSFNLSSTRLLVGFVKAHIKMWDISGNEGKLLRSIDVNQGPGYAVSFVRFLPDPTMAVYADTNGSVFQLIFKRGIGGRSTDLECFFSGSRGEILCLESLFIPKHMKRHELEEYSLLAMASFTKVIIVSCKPQLKVKYMHPLKGRPDTLPQLEWSYNTRISESDVVNNRDVFLTFARNMDVYILKISPQNKSILDLSGESNNSDLKFELVFHLVLEVQILSIKWMNSYFVGVIDFEERFHAIDVQTKSIIESLDMKSAQIIYNTSLFKSIATGGNVSEAMSIAAERACYHSVIDQNGQIKILGQQEMHILMLRPWMEAVDVVHKNQGPEEAFKMCSELYKGNNLVCRQVLMLPNKTEERQRAVTKVAINLIESILSSTLTVFTDFHSLFNAMLDLCVTMKQLSFFTNNIFGKLANDTEKEIAFIRSILPLILNNTINILHPELVQKIVEYLQNTQQFVQLDCCITKLKISCIDLDQIIKLSSKHFLFSSFIHIYNSAFNDFLTPIKKMIEFISNSEFSRCDREIQSETVIKAIVYIHCCFSGKNFFSGNALSSSISEEVKSNMFEYLVPFEKDPESTSLNVLLEYNTNEFLNMISLAFDEPFFTSDIGVSRKQAVLQKLCNHFTSNKISSFKHETVRFFVFLSRELNKTSNMSVYIDQKVLDELIERVCLGISDHSSIILDHQSTVVPVTSFLQKQAETAFLNFLKSNASYRDHWLKNERILTLSRKAQFYRVCEYIYRSKKMLHMVLECFLLDPDYRIEAFDLIESAWNDDNVDDNQRCQMMEKCFQLSEHLIMGNSTLAVIVLITVCNKRVDEVVKQLENSHSESDLRKKNTFSFLKSFFLIRNEIENKEIGVENQMTVSNQISSTIKSIKVPFHVAELFIDLLCKFERETLQTFLKYSVDYRNDAATEIISKYHLPYSLGFLYEKTKKFDLASSLYIKVFDDLWTRCIEDSELKLENCVISSSIGKSFQICIERFVHLIKKYKSHSSDIEIFWSTMLNSILQKQVSFKKQPYESMIEVIFTYFVKFLSNEIPMSTIMVTILKNPVFTGENFGKIRELMLSMMNSFNYEEILLESCISLMDKDVSNCVLQLKSMMGSGIIVYDPHCSSCLKNLIHFQIDDVDNNIISFRCGHRFHGDCLKIQKSVEKQLDIKEELFCPKCTTNLPKNKSDLRFLKEIINLNKKSEKSKLVGAQNGTSNAIGTRNIDLISSEDSSFPSTATLHSFKTDFDFSKSQKMIDIPIKLKLAPPNYLLNFCTFE